MSSASYISSALVILCVEDIRELETVSNQYTAESPNVQLSTSTHLGGHLRTCGSTTYYSTVHGITSTH